MTCEVCGCFSWEGQKSGKLVAGLNICTLASTYLLLAEVSMLNKNAIFQFLAVGLTVSNYYWVKRSAERPVSSSNEKSANK